MSFGVFEYSLIKKVYIFPSTLCRRDQCAHGKRAVGDSDVATGVLDSVKYNIFL